MLARCESVTNKAYKWYGGKGISVCTRWHEFAAFYADMGEPPFANAEIDRVDPNGDYEPSNCRWITKGENLKRARKK